MIIQLFKNKRGLIYGSDEHRIVGNVEGTLHIGSVAIEVAPGEESVLPPLGNGNYKAIFITDNAEVYELDNVVVRYGKIVQPSKEALEMMELRARVDELEAMCEALDSKVRELSNIFDTNSLNFLIK